MKFLIQTIDDKIKHDFSFTLLESIEFHKWLRNDNIEVCFTDNKIQKDYIPIGSVEFVTQYIKTYYGLQIFPKNIPTELLDEK